jgi:hypothetical protein
MKKLRLDLESLAVDTFGVLPEGSERLRGTVDGRITGFRGSACGDCGGDDPHVGDTGGDDTGGGYYGTERYSECAPVVESMMEWYTCGYQETC